MTRAASTRRAVNWPAPEDLRRDGTFACLDFVNSEWTDWRGVVAPTDRIDSPRWWKGFLSRWGVGAPGLTTPPRPRLAELRKLREMMRAAIEKRRMPTATEVSWLNGRLERSPQLWKFSAGKAGSAYRILPTRAGWPGVTALLILSFSQLLNDADRSRLKRCDNPDCTYVFYDTSTNRSRRWCFSNVCGNMMHVRAFRARRTSEAGST